VRRFFQLDISVSLIFYLLMIGSLYLLFAGHNRPGGGFVGGLVAGAAIALRYVAGGIDEVRRISPVKPWTILGVGLIVAATTATLPVLFGDPVLDNAYLELDVPVAGGIKVTSALVFDLGVYLVVVGLVLMVVEAFGERFEPADDHVEVDR
jgi:multisubunit Na+/H+ antiporter MnhB subunit